MQLSGYDANAAKEIKAFKHPEETWLTSVSAVVNKPFEWAADGAMYALDAVQLKGLIEKAFDGLLRMVNDGATWTVPRDWVIADVAKASGNTLKTFDDVLGADLKDCDHAIAGFSAKYAAVALAEGGATGLLGIAGIAPNIIALLTLSLRAINETAAYYGFDSSLEHERVFAIHVLGIASSSGDKASVGARQVLIAQAQQIAKMAAKGATWKKLDQYVLVQAVKRVFEQLGPRLTKAKLADLVPVVATVIAAGFDSYFVRSVCIAAYHLYRERHLAARYGEQILA